MQDNDMTDKRKISDQVILLDTMDQNCRVGWDSNDLSKFHNEQVRKVVHMTSECPENYIRTKPGGVKETTLTYHTFFTNQLIPKLDKFIDNKNIGTMREMTQELVGGRVLTSETMCYQPILIELLGVLLLLQQHMHFSSSHRASMGTLRNVVEMTYTPKTRDCSQSSSQPFKKCILQIVRENK